MLCDRGMPTWQAIDGNGDGEISQIEFIKALRRDKNLAVSCAAACLAFFLSAPCVCVPVGLGHFLAKSCGAAGKSGTPHPDPSRILVASPVRNAFESRGSPHDLCCVADASSLRLRCHCGIALILTVRARTRVCIRAR